MSNALMSCRLDKRKRRFLLLIVACGLLSVVLPHNYRHSNRLIEIIASMTKGVSTRAVLPTGAQETQKSNVGDGSSGSRTHYDFVEFKKKPGWHFVDFPCHYKCSTPTGSVSVTVRFTNATVDIAGADAVFFSTGPMTFEEWEALHRFRSPGQVWVFATQEPASIVSDFLPPKIYKPSTYNWSFTFHSTSDIHGAYGWYTPNNAKLTKKSVDWYSRKPKLASWVSSRHCQGLGWNRTQFVLDLGRHIDIDMYGQCGKIALRKNTNIAKGVFTKYKFHLSLENSCCSEYLSEKVWNSLDKWESVPIVLGGTREEYQKLMPPHSYIHADDFDSIEDLARHIKAVSQNKTLYNEYFAWRSIGTVKQQDFHYRFPVFKEGACKIASKLRTTEAQELDPKYFDPYDSNWFGSCYRCGDHNWIQDYVNFERRTIFSKEWEDNRTLYWRDKKD